MRSFPTFLIAASIALLLGACDTSKDDPAPSQPLPIMLVQGGQSRYKIVLDDDASASEQQAAVDLQAEIEATTGARLPIVQGLPTGGGPMIVLGDGPIARGLGVRADAARIGQQGARVRVTDPHVVIAGAPEGGTLFTTYRFIEEHLGVRWLAPEVTHRPALEQIRVPQGEHLERPAFPWRHVSYNWPGADDAFRAHIADNYGDGTGDDPFGIQINGFRGVHTYFHFVSPDEFFHSHPEYFSEIGGMRRRHDTQLCLTNPDVLEIVTERLLEKMAEDPDARHHNFGQKDQYNYCTCDNCRAMNALYGTNGGTNIWFTNELAKRTAQIFPGKIIKTLAYMYSEEPPKGLELHPNVAVYLCHMYPSCDSHPITSCEHNATFKRRAEAWAALTDHLFIWHYIVDFTHYYTPFPNLRALAENLRFYRDIGVEGIMLQGMGSKGGGGEFALLRGYYGARLLWDPDQDADALMREFLDLYYGAAAGPLAAYIDLLHDEVFDHDIHMHLYTNPAQGYLPDDLLAQAANFFQQAEAAVTGDAVLLDRVRVAALPVWYARFFPRNGYRIENRKLVWAEGSASFWETLGAVQFMEAHGFERASEQYGDIDTLLLMGLLMAIDWPAPTIENDHLTVEVLPVLGGRIARVIHRASGTNATAFNVPRGLFFPFAGGLETRVGSGSYFSGFADQWRVVNRDALSMVLAVTTMDGWQLERTLSLVADQPVLEVETVLTNPDSKARTIRLRHHLELDLPAVGGARLELVDGPGNARDQGLDEVIARQREGIYYFSDAMPAEGLRLRCGNGLIVTHRFDRSGLDHAWVWCYPPEHEELEIEISTPVITLAPGASITLNDSLEVLPE